MAFQHGTPISSAKDGTVTWAGNKGNGYGNYVIIDHGNGYSTLYGHGSSVTCKIGDVVPVGQVVMMSGSTGKSTGPHLHFEVRINNKPVNPYPYLFQD